MAGGYLWITFSIKKYSQETQQLLTGNNSKFHVKTCPRQLNISLKNSIYSLKRIFLVHVYFCLLNPKYFSKPPLARKSIETTNIWNNFWKINFAVIHSVLEESLLHQDANYQGSTICPAPSWILNTLRLGPQKPWRRDSLQVEFGCVKGTMQLLQWKKAGRPPRTYRYHVQTH